MKTHFIKLKTLLFLWLIVGLPTLIFAQGSISGTISEGVKSPILGAGVTIKNLNKGAVSDANGKYSI